LKPAAYGLNAHVELQVLNAGARNRRRPCGGGDQPAFRSPPVKPAPAAIGGVRETYDRYKYLDERTDAFEKLAAIVDGILNPNPLRTARRDGH
jgi:hypothetical protein